jgi:hypothetical protein
MTQEISEEKEKYFFLVVLHPSGDCNIKRYNTLEEAASKAYSMGNLEDDLIRVDICPSYDPKWDIKFRRAYNKKLLQKKQKLQKLSYNKVEKILT